MVFLRYENVLFSSDRHVRHARQRCMLSMIISISESFKDYDFFSASMT